MTLVVAPAVGVRGSSIGTPSTSSRSTICRRAFAFDIWKLTWLISVVIRPVLRASTEMNRSPCGGGPAIPHLVA